MMISGETLTIIMSDKELQDEFIDFVSKMTVVIAARVTPLQKANIVKLIK